MPNIFQTRGSDGNAPFGYGAEEIVGFVTSDLNDYWSTALAAQGITVPALTVVPVQSADEVECEQTAGSFDAGAVLCPATNQVFFDEPLARDLYDRFGDFVVGYILGGAWSEAAQLGPRQPAAGRAAAPDRRLHDGRLGAVDRAGRGRDEAASPARPSNPATSTRRSRRRW